MLELLHAELQLRSQLQLSMMPSYKPNKRCCDSQIYTFPY